MASVKTAISIQESLIRRAQELAEELNVSRSRLFAMAMEEFLSRHEAREVLKELDEVHGERPEAADAAFVDASRAALARLTGEDRW